MSFASNECVPIDSFKICGYRIPVTSDEILACQDSGCRVNKHFEGLVKPTEPCKVFCFLRAVHKSSWERNRSIHSDKQIAMFWQASAIVRVQISYLTQHISISPKCCSSSLFRSTSWGAKKCIQLVHNANLSWRINLVISLLSRTHCSLLISLQWINRRFEKPWNDPLCSIHLLHGEYNNITVLASKLAFSSSNPSDSRILWPADSLSDHIPSSKWLAVTSPSSPKHTVQLKKTKHQN